MSSERPDYVICVKRPEGKIGWCGLAIVGFFFTDIEHALLNGEQGGRLLLCYDCEAKIAEALRTASSGVAPIDVERMDDLAMRTRTSDEEAEFVELRRRDQIRHEMGPTLPAPIRAEIDRILQRKRGGDA